MIGVGMTGEKCARAELNYDGNPPFLSVKLLLYTKLCK
jgi:hypothetical protein